MEVSDASYTIISDLLAERTGQHLGENRRWRIASSLSGIFREHGISNLDQLVCLLADEGDPKLSQDVVEALLNNETYFFRDKPSFDRLMQEVMPALAQRRSADRRLRIWCAGCSTGQEVQSLAIQFAEQRARWIDWSIEILGTDVSHKVINAARSGNYSQFEVQRGLSVTQMLNHFDEAGNTWRIRADTRKNAIFQQHNILNEPPSRTRYDLILCRNVLIYFDAETRARVFQRLHEALAPDGLLMLGGGETVVGQTDLFLPSAAKPGFCEPVNDRQSSTVVMAALK